MYLLLCASHFKSQRCYVVRYIVRYCEFKTRMVSAPTGPIPYLYLDLFSSFALSALCVLCMNHSDPTWIKSCDDKNVFYFWYSYHSYYGMLWNVPVTQISP